MEPNRDTLHTAASIAAWPGNAGNAKRAPVTVCRATDASNQRGTGAEPAHAPQLASYCLSLARAGDAGFRGGVRLAPATQWGVHAISQHLTVTCEAKPDTSLKIRKGPTLKKCVKSIDVP